MTDIRNSDITYLYTTCPGGSCPPSRVTWAPTLCPGAIVGMVTDQNTGDPLGDVQIWSESFDTGDASSATTDDLGRYLVGDLTEGTGYLINFFSPDHSTLQVMDLTLPINGLFNDNVLAGYGSIQGNVTDSDGNPIGDAIVYFSQADNPGFGFRQCATDENGNFSCCSLDGASLDGTTQSVDYNILAISAAYSYDFETVSVAPQNDPSDIIMVSLILGPRATVQGQVTSQGSVVSGASVFVFDCDASVLLDNVLASTDDDGMYSLSLSAPATYEIAISGVDTATAKPSASVNPSDSLILNQDIGGSGTISGSVTDDDGNPISGVIIEALAPTGQGPIGQAVTDIDGAYTVLAVPPRQYSVVAIMPGSSACMKYPIVTDVIVTESETTVVDLVGNLTSPSCSILDPADEAVVSGMVSIITFSSDEAGVSFETVCVDDTNIGYSDGGGTSTIDWDSSSVSNGSHMVSAIAYNLYGISAQVNITIEVSN